MLQVCEHFIWIQILLLICLHVKPVIFFIYFLRVTDTRKLNFVCRKLTEMSILTQMDVCMACHSNWFYIVFNFYIYFISGTKTDTFQRHSNQLCMICFGKPLEPIAALNCQAAWRCPVPAGQQTKAHQLALYRQCLLNWWRRIQDKLMRKSQ